jgi:HAD superfamily hydrolase (TIGR01549 family)
MSVEEMMALTLSRVARQNSLSDISDQAHSIYAEVYFDSLQIFPETTAVLDSLFKNKVKMVVASDADAQLIENQLTKFGLSKYFSDRCVSGAVQAYKPSERFIRNLLKHIRDKQESYFVGDNWVDVESGKRLGICSIHINRKNGGNPFQADHVVTKLTELLPILGIV